MHGGRRRARRPFVAALALLHIDEIGPRRLQRPVDVVEVAAGDQREAPAEPLHRGRVMRGPLEIEHDRLEPSRSSQPRA